MPALIDLGQLPGFRARIDFTPKRALESYFNNYHRHTSPGYNDFGWEAVNVPPLTLRELAMLQFMNAVTDKDNWDQKVFEPEITNKWKIEAIEAEGTDFTQAMADYCIAELKHKTKALHENGCVVVFNGEVVKSDSRIPEALRVKLSAAAMKLEDIPEEDKDWHPGSNNQVLDLVHPSLFPLVYGRSRILTNDTVAVEDCLSKSGKGIQLRTPAPDQRDQHRTLDIFSRRFQWLPSNIEFEGDQGKVRFSSYINNLRPDHHKHLYKVVEEILACVIPQWNLTLWPIHGPSPEPRIQVDSIELEPGPEGYPQELQSPIGSDYESDTEEGWDLHKRRINWIEATVAYFVPDAPSTPEPSDFVRTAESYASDVFKPKICRLQDDWKHQGLQVIVKLANINLTPEKPDYPGGTWHIEGQANEQICALAIYYYDIENITPSRLSFRQKIDPHAFDEISHINQRNDWLKHVWLKQLYGVDDEEAIALQRVGSVVTQQGRLVTFPNILHHKVEPFSLEDKARPGHSKILCFFLVDPNIRIISTANVPPQRRDWWEDEIWRIQPSCRLSRLPPELMIQVLSYVDYPIPLSEAKTLREELMAERKVFVVGIENELGRQHYNV